MDPIYNYELYSKEVKYGLQKTINRAKYLLNQVKMKTKDSNDESGNPIQLIMEIR